MAATAREMADVYSSNIATNRTGNLYQAGEFATTLSLGIYSITSPAEEDVFLVKYDQNGNPLWVNHSVGGINSFALSYSVASDDSDNSYLTGSVDNGVGQRKDTISFGTHTLYFPGRGQFFLVKYNSSGHIMWAVQPDSTSFYYTTESWAVATDKFGHEYVAGDGAFLIKYDRNGNVKWTLPQQNKLVGLYKDVGYSVATDAGGNIYMAGIFTDSLRFGATALYNPNGAIFIAKFDSNGNALWAQQSTGSYSSSYLYSLSVAVDRSGAAYITGTLTTGSISLGSYSLSSGTTSSFFVAKFNADGGIAWAETALPANNTYCGSYSIAADDSNHIYISGTEQRAKLTTASFSLSNYSVSIIDTLDGDDPSFILKLDTTGKVLCSSVLMAGGAYQNTVTSDSTGRFVYMGGMFRESFSIGNDVLNNKTGGFDTYAGRWDPCGTCDFEAIATPSSATICDGQSIVLTAGGGTSYTWSPATGLSATTGDSVIANPTVNTTYTITGTAIGGCTSIITDTVLILPAPNIPTITITVTGDSLISSANSYNQWNFDGQLINDSTRQVLVIKGHAKGWYSATVTNPANGCSSTSDSTTSIKQLFSISNQLSIYPNPFNNNITIKISPTVTTISTWNLQLNDVLGRTVYTETSLNYNNELDLSGLPAGIYFISVSNNKGRQVFPIVKQN